MTQTLPNLDLGAEARPFLKWVGGKRQLLAHLRAAAPARFGRYHEPFLGGGALFFELAPERAVLSDGNERLIRTYRGVRGSIERVLDHLAGYRHERAFFEELRTRPIDRYDDPELAAWMIYLNKTGFNGLYRVNSKNVFNVPFGDFAKPNFRDERNLRAVSARLANADLRCDDFAGVLDAAEKGDFVYFDPPYVPLSHSSSFTSYTKDGFGMDEQLRLAEIARTLKRRKVHVLLSNSSAPAVYELYSKDFEILEVSASRSVNARGDGRGKIKELLIRLGSRSRSGKTAAELAVVRSALLPFAKALMRTRLSRSALPAFGLFVAFAVLCPAGAHADIYKHVDADGVIHFSNTKGGGAQLVARDKKKRNVTPFMPSDVSMERFTRFDEHIRQAATLYQLPEELVRAVIMVESNYDPRATSTAGAQGLMQLMPETAARMEVKDILDPRENIFGGTRYLRVLANLFNGDLELTIAGYNAGEGAVMRYGGIPPYAETQDYVVKVLTYYRRYRATRDALAASVGNAEPPPAPLRGSEERPPPRRRVWPGG